MVIRPAVTEITRTRSYLSATHRRNVRRTGRMQTKGVYDDFRRLPSRSKLKHASNAHAGSYEGTTQAKRERGGKPEARNSELENKERSSDPTGFCHWDTSDECYNTGDISAASVHDAASSKRE